MRRARSRLRRVLVTCAALLCVAPALAVSPPDQYDTFTRDTSVIHDAKTNLDWQRTPGGQMPWATAKAYCASLTLVSDGKTFTDLRLPTYKELLTLVDENPRYELVNGAYVLTAIDANAFPQTPAAYFWTSTPNATDPAEAWRVAFNTGESSPDLASSAYYVRCVK